MKGSTIQGGTSMGDQPSSPSQQEARLKTCSKCSSFIESAIASAPASLIGLTERERVAREREQGLRASVLHVSTPDIPFLDKSRLVSDVVSSCTIRDAPSSERSFPLKSSDTKGGLVSSAKIIDRF